MFFILFSVVVVLAYFYGRVIQLEAEISALRTKLAAKNGSEQALDLDQFGVTHVVVDYVSPSGSKAAKDGH